MNITQKEYQLLREEINQLKADNRRLIAKVEELTRENIELRDKLGLNSSNSSLPSSRDLYKIRKSTKQRSGRKPGGQKGHIGTTRDRMAPDEIIRIKLSEQFCTCGHAISRDKDSRIIQTVEIPPIKPHVTEYQLDRGRCSHCRKYYSAHLPDGVTPDLLGQRLKTIIASLTSMFKGSKREVQAVLQNVFGVKIALGTVSNTERRVSEYCKDAYDQLVMEIKSSEQIHADETGHKNKGMRYWAWLFTHSKATVLMLKPSRGMKVLQQILPEFKGRIISDRYAAYNYFPQKNRQICWAHLARDFERIANSSHLTVSVYGKYLRSGAQELFAGHRALRDNMITKQLFFRRLSKLRRRQMYYLKQLLKIENIPRVHNSVQLMIQAESMMWTFLQDPLRIPLMNNAAEQQIRPFVIYRKKSFFTWSERGDRFLERLISLHLTWKQNNKNPFEQLYNLIAA